MANNRPQDFVNLAELGIIVAKSWENNYPTYLVKFSSFSLLATTSASFKTKSVENASHDMNKSNNSKMLKNVNAEIDAAVKSLRKYIQAENPNEKDFSKLYIAYGLESNKQGTYGLIKDNDRRRQRITLLIAKLSEPGNIIASQTYGLLFWQNLQERHNIEWDKSKTMKTHKATLSHETRTLFNEVNEILRKLKAQIKIDFPKTEHSKVLREFGFLGEVYK